MKHLIWLLAILLIFFVPTVGMGGTKISALPVLTTIASGDLFGTVDISEAVEANKTKQITWLELMAAPGAIGGTTSAAGTFIRAVFEEDAGRTGEGTALFANGLPIGMATPGDCQGMKMEFNYGVSPTLTGGGKVAQGLMLKMTMDQEWSFSSANRNADVRGASIQVELNDNLGGMLDGIYANAYTDIATNKEITGEHTTAAYGVGMTALEARTEIKGNGTLTVPHIAGVYILHRRMGSGGVTGDYHAIHIENSQNTGAISGTETGIHFEPNTMAPPGASFDYGIDMNAVSFDTADIRGQYGETISNATDGTWAFGSAKITTPEVEYATAITIDSTGAGVNITTHTDATDDFTVNSTMVVVEGDSGNVGIGTATPGVALHVGSAAYTARFAGSTYTGEPQIYSLQSSGEAAIAVSVIDATDNRVLKLFSSDTSSAVGLWQSGSANPYPFVIGNATTEWLKLSTSGELTIENLDDAAGTYPVEYNTTSKELTYDSSSEKRKSNIQEKEIPLDTLLRLFSLTLMTYEKAEMTDTGYIAEDLDEVGLNDLVVYESDGVTPDGINFKDINFYILNLLRSLMWPSLSTPQKNSIETLARNQWKRQWRRDNATETYYPSAVEAETAAVALWDTGTEKYAWLKALTS